MGKTSAATALVWMLLPGLAFAQDAKTTIEDATKAMGAVGLTSITYSGIAATANFGQSRTISFGLSSTSVRDYTRTIDFAQPASRATGSTLPPPVRGGPPPQPGTLDQSITSATPAWAQQMQIWMTPWGFLRGAAANMATVRSRKIDGVTYRVVTWSPAQKAPSGQSYKVIGYLNDANIVERVETWVEHPILGDMHVEFRYSEYHDFGGLKFPGRISQRQVGMETFVAAISAAVANPPNLDRLMTVPVPGATPGPGRGAQAAPQASPVVASEKLADGVYRITGGYVSLAVDFKDYVVVLEGGQNEARGQAVLAETKRLFPNKRIRYVVNSHPHFDHAGGLAPFAADGITILTDDNNKFFLENALGSPRTLVGDVLAKSGKRPRIEGVIEKLVLKDEAHSVELHHVVNLDHSDGMLIAYLPKERILFTADFAVPAPGQPVSASIATLVSNIERLRLDFDRHIPVHALNPDRTVSRADLLALAKGAN